MRFYNYRKEIGEALDSNITNGRFRIVADEMKAKDGSIMPQGPLDVANYTHEKSMKKFIANDLIVFLRGLDRINTIKDHQKAIDGMSFDEIEVPSFIKELINPIAVYLDPANQLCSDLVDYSYDKSTVMMDWVEFKNACIRLCARIRQGKTWSYVKLSECLKVVALTDVYTRSITKDVIHFDNTYDKAPFDLVDITGLVCDEYFYLEAKSYISKFITYTLVPLMKDSAA